MPSAALMRFAQAFDIPVATSFRRTHVVDPLHPSYAGDLGSGPNPKLLARVKAADLVLVIMNRRGLQYRVRTQFKVGADAGVAAGPVGRDAQASTDIQLRAQILSYSRARGLFAGVTINGSTVRQDRDANERFYGTAYRTSQIVFDGLGGSPEPVGNWKATLAKYAR